MEQELRAGGSARLSAGVADHVRRLFDLSLDLHCVATFGGELLEVNPAWERTLGWRAEELIGRRYLGLVHPDDVDATVAAATSLSRGEFKVGFENRYRHRDGTYRWLAWNGTPVPEEGLVYAVVRDVTEVKARQAELDEARGQVEEAHRLARLGHWSADMVTGALHWSPMVYEILGIDPNLGPPDLDGFYSRVHPDDRARVQAGERAAVDTGRHDIRFRILATDGSVRWVEEHARAEVAEDGSLRRLIGTIQDVTALEEAEQEVRAGRQRLHRILDSTRDGWWESDLVAGTTYHSDRWWELHGLQPGDRPEHPGLWRELTDPAELPRVDAAIAAAVAAGRESVDLRGRIVHADGRRIPVNVRALFEYGPEGELVRARGTTRDITDLVQAEQVKDEFISTVSHELRTPLTAIGGVIELLLAGRAGVVPAAGVALLEVAARNTHRLRALIDDLLDVERLAAGGGGLTAVATPLAPLLERATEDLSALATSRGVHLRLGSLPPPEIRVQVDVTQIDRALANYVANACRFAPAGTDVELTCAVHDEEVEVSVTDRGPGVPESFRARAFQRFSQADTGDRRERGGTGLGLAICREIVERHGGRVGYDSRPGYTRFWLTLPRA